MKKTKSTILIMSMTIALALFIQTKAEARGMFSTFKQRVIYSSAPTEAEVTVNKGGLSIKSSTSGSDVIGTQDYCGFWFIDYCDSEKVNKIVLLPT